MIKLDQNPMKIPFFPGIAPGPKRFRRFRHLRHLWGQQPTPEQMDH